MLSKQRAKSLPNTADSIPGAAILACIADMGIARSMLVRFSNVAFPSKKNTLSGMPIATFHRMIIIKSTMLASDPTTREKMRAERYFHELINVW